MATIYKRGAIWWLNDKGRRSSLRTSDETEAKRALSVHSSRPLGASFPADERDNILRRTKQHARERGITFVLTDDDLDSLINRSMGYCEVSGIAFDFSYKCGVMRKRPWGASIDRIDSSKGYELENCRLVCVAVNFALSAWGESVLMRIADGMASMRSCN